MIVRKRKVPFIPCAVSIFKAWSKVAQFYPFNWLLKYFFCKIIYLFVLEQQRDGNREIRFWSPPIDKERKYPVAISGVREYDFFLIY